MNPCTTMNQCTTMNHFSVHGKISEPKQYIPSTHSSKQNEDNKVLGMSAKLIIGVAYSGIGWFSTKTWLRRCIKTSVGEHIGRRHLGGRFIKMGFFIKEGAGALRAAASPSPPIPRRMAFWEGGRRGPGARWAPFRTDRAGRRDPEAPIRAKAFPRRKYLHARRLSREHIH